MHLKEHPLQTEHPLLSTHRMPSLYINRIAMPDSGVAFLHNQKILEVSRKLLGKICTGVGGQKELGGSALTADLGRDPSHLYFLSLHLAGRQK